MNDQTDYIRDEEFRDSMATVDKAGKRIWLYPKKPKGRFYNYRTYLSFFFLLILFLLPLLKINGEPFVLFNILERNFILFGFHFGPHDFYLFVIAMLILVVFIILFTVVFGRLFCGWVCPQTIFMELVFRKIEYWIEGDGNAQRRLDKQEWNTDKVIKKTSKHLIFFAIAVLIANTFLAYIIGIDEVVDIISEPVSLHLTGFISMMFFSFLFYGVFAKMREQVCIAICPYGRLQGVLLDNKSLVVAYDFVRGEPRGKIQKNRNTSLELKAKTNIEADTEVDFIDNFNKKLGDCIDCSLCVQVCPTGIDIRHGTQLECVNCTACMDACDEVMEKIDRPKGLIRIDSIEGIEKGKQSLFNTRVIAYSVVLLLLIIAEVLLFSLRSDIEVLLLRTPGMLSREMEDGRISNLYNYQMINKTNVDYPAIEFRLINIEGEVITVGEKTPEVKKNDMSKGALFIHIPKEFLQSGKNDIEVGVYAEGKLIEKVKSSFFGPVK